MSVEHLSEAAVIENTVITNEKQFTMSYGISDNVQRIIDHLNGLD